MAQLFMVTLLVGGKKFGNFGPHDSRRSAAIDAKRLVRLYVGPNVSIDEHVLAGSGGQKKVTGTSSKGKKWSYLKHKYPTVIAYSATGPKGKLEARIGQVKGQAPTLANPRGQGKRWTVIVGSDLGSRYVYRGSSKEEANAAFDRYAGGSDSVTIYWNGTSATRDYFPAGQDAWSAESRMAPASSAVVPNPKKKAADTGRVCTSCYGDGCDVCHFSGRIYRRRGAAPKGVDMTSDRTRPNPGRSHDVMDEVRGIARVMKKKGMSGQPGEALPPGISPQAHAWINANLSSFRGVIHGMPKRNPSRPTCDLAALIRECTIIKRKLQRCAEEGYTAANISKTGSLNTQLLRLIGEAEACGCENDLLNAINK